MTVKTKGGIKKSGSARCVFFRNSYNGLLLYNVYQFDDRSLIVKIANLYTMERTDFIAQSSHLLDPLHKRLKLMKAVGGSLLVLTTFGCVMSIVQMALTPTEQKLSYNCSIAQSGSDVEANTSICYTVHRYPLSNELYLTVCKRQNRTYLRFQKYTEQEKQLDITTFQWLYLKRTVSHIDQSIHEAGQLTHTPILSHYY